MGTLIQRALILDIGKSIMRDPSGVIHTEALKTTFGKLFRRVPTSRRHRIRTVTPRRIVGLNPSIGCYLHLLCPPPQANV